MNLEEIQARQKEALEKAIGGPLPGGGTTGGTPSQNEENETFQKLMEMFQGPRSGFSPIPSPVR